MSRTLLLADDSITIQRVIELTFTEQGINVVSVSDGQQAVDSLAQRRPDIMLVGVTLPKLDGYEVAKYVQQQSRLRGVPLLLLAGAFDTLDEGRVKESGAAGVVFKPFEPRLVINRVKELLGLSTKVAETPDVASAAPSGRLVTSQEPPQTATNVDGPPLGVPEADATAPPEPPTMDVDSAIVTPAGDDLNQLDATFDLLDAQLARDPVLAGRVMNPAPGEHSGAHDTSSRGPASESTNLPLPSSAAAVGTAGSQPAFTAAEEATPTFDVGGERSSTAAAAKAAADLSHALREFASSEATQPAVRVSAYGPDMADAFAALLAEEQGEPAPNHPRPVRPMEISDDALDRIAAGVADRLIHGLLGENVARTVSEVSERLVRDEIARIRASATKNP